MKTENRCSFEIDYSEIPGEKILPFTVSLNTEESVLYPSEGQLQKFCYLITGLAPICRFKSFSAEYLQYHHPGGYFRNYSFH